jgi:hypothetical protein
LNGRGRAYFLVVFSFEILAKGNFKVKGVGLELCGMPGMCCAELLPSD